MKRDERREQIISELEETGLMMHPFYKKQDIEQELREFQAQMVLKVFDETHGQELRIDDVQAHINELAQDKGIEQSQELVRFNEKTEDFKVLIAKEIAGNNGERYMNKTIRMLKDNYDFLSNVELSEDGFVTEIDGIVITRKAIFLLETKYSVRDMMITEEGNYVEKEKPDEIYCNIGEKINIKEHLIRYALENAGFDKEIKIEKMVVFSNYRSQLVNRFKYISSCYCSHLPHIIDEYKGAEIYSLADIHTVKNILEGARISKEYQVDFDFREYRFLFADALAYTEIGLEKKVADEKEQIVCTDKHKVGLGKLITYGAMVTGLTLFTAKKIVKKI